jgi:hypothetical protein
MLAKSGQCSKNLCRAGVGASMSLTKTLRPSRLMAADPSLGVLHCDHDPAQSRGLCASTSFSKKQLSSTPGKKKCRVSVVVVDKVEDGCSDADAIAVAASDSNLFTFRTIGLRQELPYSIPGC